MIRVLIVNEVRLMCNVIGSVLKNEADIEVVGCATTVEEALPQLQQCDVALVGTNLPNSGALELARYAKNNPPAKIIAVGLTESESTILRFIEAGASGYVLKEDSVDEMLRTLRAVESGEALVSPNIAALLMNRVAQLAEANLPMDGATNHPGVMPELTRREREVLGLIAQGFCNQEIAEHLAIEVGTAKNHVHNILEKLNVSSRKEAVAYLGLV